MLSVLQEIKCFNEISSACPVEFHKTVTEKQNDSFCILYVVAG